MAKTATKTATRQDPLPSFCFLVRFTALTGTTDTYFRSVGGLTSETEVVPVKAGGVNDTTFNLVGGVKWSNIVLKQGFTASSAVMKWREEWVSGTKMTRSNGTIIQLDTALTPRAAWTFVRGWPAKWSIADFDATKSELSIETLEICHEGLKSSPAPPK